LKDLTEIDFKLLRYISSHPSATLKDLKNKFSKISNLEHRLKVLSTSSKEFPAVLKEEFKIQGRGAYSQKINLGIFIVTDFGKLALQDYSCKTKSHKKEVWLKNAWIPIIVSFLTYLLLNYIIPLLLHLLRQLFYSL